MSQEVKEDQLPQQGDGEQTAEQVSAQQVDPHLLDAIRMEFADTSERFYHVFKKILDGKMEEDTASHLAEMLLKAMDLRQASQPEVTEIACRRGCSHCCYNLVTASAPELSYLADHIKSLPGEESAAIQNRVHEAAGKVAGMDTSERIAAHVPCPLLGEDGACSVYEQRPMSCRAFVSFDVDACISEISGKDVAVPSGPNGQTQRLLLIIAFKRALMEKGRDIASLEMIAGLNKVLTTPDAMDKWTEGEHIFDSEIYGDRAAHEAWVEKMVADLTSYQLKIPETDLSYIPGEQTTPTGKLN